MWRDLNVAGVRCERSWMGEDLGLVYRFLYINVLVSVCVCICECEWVWVYTVCLDIRSRLCRNYSLEALTFQVVRSEVKSRPS